MIDSAEALQRHKMMAEKLQEQVATGNIDACRECDFIWDMHQRTQAGTPLTEKQAAWLESLFEKY